MKTKWIIWYATLLHLWWGIFFVFNHVPHEALITRWFLLNGTPSVWGSVFIVTGLLSILGLLTTATKWSLVALIPQQCLLLIGLFGFINVAWDNPRFWISFSNVLLPAALHTCAMIEEFGHWDGIRHV